MSYTRAQWAAGFLIAAGNLNPSPSTVNWVVGWTKFETTGPPGATYNLLNTTQDAPGATAFNHFGPHKEYSVKNYVSFVQGVQSNAKALANGLYPTLYQALKTNNVGALGIGAVPAASINRELSTWGTGPKAAQIAAAAGQGANDQFPGSLGGTNGPIKVDSAAKNTYPPGQCTWWASERYHTLTGYYVPWAGNANDWAVQAKKYQGWSVSNQPSAPSIICLQAGVQLADASYGHVAVVEKINPDGSVVASNSNWAGHVYPHTVMVEFKTGPGVTFITAGGDQPGQGTADTPGVDLGGDLGNLFGAIGALFGSVQPPKVESALQQVHETLVSAPGFYGISLALDEAEQFPGWQNLATGPFDVIGVVRSIGASVGDNFLPFWIRGGLIALGMLIIMLLILKVVLQVGEGALQAVGPLLPLIGA